MKKLPIPIICALTVILVTGGLTALYKLTIIRVSLNALENKIYDQRLLFRYVLSQGSANTQRIIDDVVVIDIDEKSLRDLGNYRQWPRAYFARMVDTLSLKGATAIGFDVLFAETDSLSDDMIRLYRDIIGPSSTVPPSEIEKIFRSLSTDTLLAAAIARAGQVYLSAHIIPSAQSTISAETTPDITAFRDKLIAYPLEETDIGRLNNRYDENYQLVPPVTMLSRASKRIGFVHADQDSDGVIRRFPLYLHYQGQNFVNFSFQLAMDLLGESPQTLRFKPDFGVIGKSIAIPTDESGNLFINYQGKSRAIRTLSFSDVLQGRIQYNFTGKIYLIGASAAGLEDLKTTPLTTRNYPGVEIHATIIHSLLNHDFIRKPRFYPTTFLLTLGLCFIISLISYRFRPVGSAGIYFIGMLAYCVFAFMLFATAQIWLEVVFPVAGIVLTLICILTYRFRMEERDKRHIRSLFSSYVSPQIVQQMIEDPQRVGLGGEKRELTVMFTDIRGFTTISEQMASDQLVMFMNEYLTAMHDVVNQYDGTIDKYIGDAVMAFFGAPIALPDHAERCCRTALGMIARLNQLNIIWRDLGLPMIEIGVGINTGEVHVGNMGSIKRFDYTVMGDNVNLASRLEGLNKHYGTTILVGPNTYAAVKERFLFRQLDMVRVKGKHKPVVIYQLLIDQAETAQTRVRTFEAGLIAYHQRQWLTALAHFEDCLKVDTGDVPAEIFCERCRHYLVAPPSDDWDGVWEMTEK